MAFKFKPFSSKDAVVCRNVTKIWAEDTARAHVARLRMFRSNLTPITAARRLALMR